MRHIPFLRQTDLREFLVKGGLSEAEQDELLEQEEELPAEEPAVA